MNISILSVLSTNITNIIFFFVQKTPTFSYKINLFIYELDLIKSLQYLYLTILLEDNLSYNIILFVFSLNSYHYFLQYLFFVTIIYLSFLSPITMFLPLYIIINTFIASLSVFKTVRFLFITISVGYFCTSYLYIVLYITIIISIMLYYKLLFSC